MSKFDTLLSHYRDACVELEESIQSRKNIKLATFNLICAESRLTAYHDDLLLTNKKLSDRVNSQ